MSRKIRVAVLFGGRSAEHEVSVTSARSLLQAIDRDKYDVTMIPITKEGRWLSQAEAARVLAAGLAEGDSILPVLFDHRGAGAPMTSADGNASVQAVDVVFPILHGPFGEDGTIQGLLELAGVAYVGSGVLGSAVGMDKEMMRRALHADGLPTVDSTAVLRSRWRHQAAAVTTEIKSRFTYPIFVKPANMGSSVGISKVNSDAELGQAMDTAASYDRKIIIEADAGDCREVECSVLGYEELQVSVVGEVVSSNEFYDYNAKYVEDNSELIIPADLQPSVIAEVQDLSCRAFLAVDACGLARVDFFVRPNGEVTVNEINTLPGFTPISMYPKLWEASGLGYGDLIDRLIQLALERHADRQDISAEGGTARPVAGDHTRKEK